MIDIRLPIGLMFSIVGAILAIYGFATSTDPGFYLSSAGININLFMGFFMLAFGLIMLYFAGLKRKIPKPGKKTRYSDER